MKKTVQSGMILIILLTMTGVKVVAQDIHFSQIGETAITNNPAATGLFYGDIRAGLIYRDQWRSVTVPYTTYAMVFDTKIKRWEESYLGVGTFIYKDKAGDNNLSTTQANLMLSYHINLNDHHKLGAGIQGGYGQQTIKQGSMQWDNQYDGTGYNPALGSGEIRSFEPALWLDISGGIAWSYSSGHRTISSNDGILANAGVAVYHSNNPALSLYGMAEEKLYRKAVFHSDLFLGITNTDLAFKSSVLVSLQGKSTEIVTGAMLRYRISEGSHYTGFVQEFAISAGTYYRHQDALIPSLLLEYSNFALGFGYDFNISPLKASSNNRGGMEFILRFVNPNPFSNKDHHASFN